MCRWTSGGSDRADLVVCLMVSNRGVRWSENMGDGIAPEEAMKAAWAKRVAQW
jgi:hypothetical protein